MPLRKRPGVAVVEVHGVIGTRVRIPVYERLFDSIAKSKRHGALVVDIDSPGGSASGSEVLYYAIRKVAAAKPVVAYVRGMGASGGYYLCCAASRVFALPSALVGSIGVIYLRPVLHQLLGKMGVEFSVFKEGRLKDMTGFWRSPTDEEEEKFQGLLTDMYANFVAVVSSGRSIDKQQVLELATGEVFTASRGKDLGLVDEFGGLDQAVEAAAGMAGVTPRPVWVRPRRPFSERLMGRFGNNQGLGTALAGELPRLLAGGIYYIEPSCLLGDYTGG